MATQGQYFEGVGRRKEATARVRLYPGGTGRIVINDKDGAAYLTRAGDMGLAFEGLRIAGMESGYDISVHVKGGGVTGQTGAIRLGVARAILKIDPEQRPNLRKAGLLTRDPRAKERKKPGLRRARKAPTYTKR
jgi:small subunit ribosomal protein S9